jgi:hypothetical protein
MKFVQYAFAIALATLTNEATSNSWTHVCTFADKITHRSIAWHVQTRSAQVILFDGKYNGRLTSQRKHTPNSNKYNLRFEFIDRSGFSETEYIVFEIEGKGWRIICANYVRADSERHLFSLGINEALQCASL